MSVQNTIRDVRVERLAARPPVEQVLARIRERKSMSAIRLSPGEILAHRDSDRR